MTAKEELKFHCLRLALEALGTPCTAEAVLEAAKKFEAHVVEGASE